MQICWRKRSNWIAHQSLSGREKRKLSACAVNLRRYCRAGRAHKQQAGKKTEVWDWAEPSPWTPQGCPLCLRAANRMFVGFCTNVMLVSMLLHTRFFIGWLVDVGRGSCAMVIPNFWLRLSSQAIFGRILSPHFSHRGYSSSGAELCSRHSWLNTRLIFWRTHLCTLRVTYQKCTVSIRRTARQWRATLFTKKVAEKKKSAKFTGLLQPKEVFIWCLFFYISKRSPHSRLKELCQGAWL